METNYILQHDRYRGNKGLDFASVATLAALALKYHAIANDLTAPPALRDYAATTAEEIREKLVTRRAASMTGAVA